MLQVEKTSNGRTMVRLIKDWNPTRMYDHQRDHLRLQTALLKEAYHAR